MDLLDFNEEDEEKRVKQLLTDAFGRLYEASMKAMQEWFEREFEVNQAAFRFFNGEWNPLDAMRQDAFRLVWMTFRLAWERSRE